MRELFSFKKKRDFFLGLFIKESDRREYKKKIICTYRIKFKSGGGCRIAVVAVVGAKTKTINTKKHVVIQQVCFVFFACYVLLDCFLFFPAFSCVCNFFLFSFLSALVCVGVVLWQSMVGINYSVMMMTIMTLSKANKVHYQLSDFFSLGHLNEFGCIIKVCIERKMCVFSSLFRLQNLCATLCFVLDLQIQFFVS